jgi:hypothetical protein
MDELYKEEKVFDDPIMNFKYQLDKGLMDEAREKLKGKGKVAICMISSIRENSTPDLFRLISDETLAYYACIGNWDYYGGLTYNKKSADQVIKYNGIYVL